MKDGKQDISLVSNYLSKNVYINCKEKTSKFIVEKPGRHSFNQMIKVNITSNGTNCHHGPHRT